VAESLSGPVLCPSGCGRVQQPGKLLCLPCWREVPKELQDDVYRTWRAYRASARSDPTFLDKSRAYRASRDAAIASIR
jgi:hypothetical protein